MRLCQVRSALLVAFPILVPPLAAQDQPERPWTLKADFGLVNTAGNTSLTTLSAGEEASITRGRWTVGQTFEAVYGRTSGQTTTEHYRVGLRSDYLLSGRMGWYLSGGWERNKPSGIERRFSEGTGLYYDVVTTRATTFRVELGVAANQQQPVTGPEEDFASGRGAVRLKHQLTGAAVFEQKAEVLPNLKQSEDLRINSESSLVAPLSERIGLKLSYVVQFDNEPEPGREKTDRFLASGITIVF